MFNVIDFGLYHELFTFIKDNAKLDPFNEVHLAVLNFISIRLINESCMHGSMLGQSIACA